MATNKDILKQILGKLAEHDKRFDTLTDELRSKHNLVMGRLNNIENGQKVLEGKVGALDTSVRVLHYDLKELSNRLEVHIKQPSH